MRLQIVTPGLPLDGDLEPKKKKFKRHKRYIPYGGGGEVGVGGEHGKDARRESGDIASL